jgi:hypothetical protein
VADKDFVVKNGLVVANGDVTVSGSATATSFIGPLTGNATTATSWSTARTISLAGVLTGSASIDGSGNVTLTAAHTSDPVITLSGAVTGTGTMTNLGSVSITTTATADPILTLAGDATGSATFTNLGNATLTVAVVDDSHAHSFNNLLNKTSGTGDYTSTGTFTGATFNATSTTGGGFQGIDADSATLPSFTWTSDQNTGIWHAAADSIGFTTAGVNRLTISTTGITSTLPITASGLTVGAITLPATDGTVGQVLTTNGSGTVTFADAAGGGGSSTFLELTDTPSSYVGASNQLVGINVGETALGFVDEIEISEFVLSAVTAPATPLSDSMAMYVTASGTTPNREVSYKMKNELGQEIIISSILV